MSMKKILGVVLSVLLGYGIAATGYAQDSAGQLLEQARAKAAEIERLKKVINEEPDQNVRHGIARWIRDDRPVTRL
jgi:hypothetical protein